MNSGWTRTERDTPVSGSLAGEMETKTGRVSVAFMPDVRPRIAGARAPRSRDRRVGEAQVKFRETEVNLTGKVVRQEDIDPNVSSLWRYKIALIVDPSPEFDQLMTELSAHRDESPETT